MLPEIKYLVVLPPPLTGMTEISLQVVRYFNENYKCVGKTISKKEKEKTIVWSFRKHILLVIGAMRLCLTKPFKTSLYIVLDSGNGSWGSLLIALIARFTATPLIVHHHVFSYFNEPVTPVKLFFMVSGKDATHVVLCNRMKEKLNLAFGADKKSIVISNKNILFPVCAIDGKVSYHKAACRKGVLKVGFLSNITFDKGIVDYISTIIKLEKTGIKIHSSIAGPATSEGVEEVIKKFISQQPAGHERKWLGSVYGKEKENFYKDIDVLLFPTRYYNEAEPLIIYEAQRYSCVVLSNMRGCIEEQLPPECICSNEDDFAVWAVNKLADFERLNEASKSFLASASSEVRPLGVLDKVINIS